MVKQGFPSDTNMVMCVIMRLIDYLAMTQTSVEDFARSIGVHEKVSVRRYMKGERIPSRPIMARIVVVTKGAVQPNDFYAPAE